jgi:hypothetical protein
MSSQTRSYRVIPTDEFLALINANNPSAVNPFATIADIVSGSTYITVVANYAALPAPNTVPGEFYYCENSQGTAWLPGPLGGTYYPKGLYYSNGVSWIVTDAPYQASQAEVGDEVGDGGIESTKFVTAQTLYGKGYSRINKVANDSIPAHRVVVLSNDQVILFDPTDPTHYNKVLGISYNSGGLGDQITVITDDEVTFGIPLVDGVIYYGGSNGTLVSTAPSTGIVQPMGMSNASGRFIVHIGTPILKA